MFEKKIIPLFLCSVIFLIGLIFVFGVYALGKCRLFESKSLVSQFDFLFGFDRLLANIYYQRKWMPTIKKMVLAIVQSVAQKKSNEGQVCFLFFLYLQSSFLGYCVC